MKLFNRTNFLRKEFYIRTQAAAEYVDLYHVLNLMSLDFVEDITVKHIRSKYVYFYVNEKGKVDYITEKPSLPVFDYNKLLFLVNKTNEVHYHHKNYTKADHVKREYILYKLKGNYKFNTYYFYSNALHNDDDHVLYLFEDILYIMNKETKLMTVYASGSSEPLSLHKKIFVYTKLYKEVMK